MKSGDKFKLFRLEDVCELDNDDLMKLMEIEGKINRIRAKKGVLEQKKISTATTDSEGVTIETYVMIYKSQQ